MSFLSLLRNSTFLYLFECCLAHTASLSLSRRPTDSCLLTTLPAPLAVFKSLKNTSVTLTYSPSAQAVRLSVDLSGRHKSGKPQRGKIRELSLTGIVWGGFQGGERGIAVCGICSWLCVRHLAYVCICIFTFFSPRECQLKALALSQGLFFSVVAQLLWRVYFKIKYMYILTIYIHLLTIMSQFEGFFS